MPGCRTAQELIGLRPSHPSDLATFTSRLRKHAILEQVAAAICQLARQLEDNGIPIDYACLRLIELLTGTHPRDLLRPPRLPATRTQQYSNFTLAMPDQLDLCLRRQARSPLSKASISEPVT